MPIEPNITGLSREQIEAKRAANLAKQREENARALKRQDAIHARAYEIHQKAMDDESIKEKPGFNKALEAATKEWDEANAAETKTTTEAQALADQIVADKLKKMVEAGARTDNAEEAESLVNREAHPPAHAETPAAEEDASHA